MSLKLILAILASVLLVSTVGAVSASEIQFLTHSLQNTYVDQDGVLHGKPHGGRRAFYLEVLHEMMTLRGVTATIAEIPFKRGLLLAQTKPNYALFNINRSRDRETTLKWVGPLLTTQSYFYKRKTDSQTYATMADAKAVTDICVLNGNQQHSNLKKQGFVNLKPNNSYANCINMLLLGRTVLTPLSDSSPALLKTEVAEQIENTGILIAKSKGYLAFSKNIPDEEINQWQAALDQLVGSGVYERLKEQFLLP